MHTNSLIKYSVLILLSALLVGGAIAILKISSGPEVRVKTHPQYKETTYSITDRNGKNISLTSYQTDTNMGILRLRSDSALPLKEQISLLANVLDRVLRDEKRSDIKTMSVGRLELAFGDNREMSERLSNAAKDSPKWDSTKGRPVSGHENNFVRDIANEAMIYPELKDMFNRRGLDIRFVSAEKVLIDPESKLPYDCMGWFAIAESE